jgi:hypothetical protein
MVRLVTFSEIQIPSRSKGEILLGGSINAVILFLLELVYIETCSKR